MSKRPPEELTINVFSMSPDERELLEAYRDRQKDKAQLKSRRQRNLETPMKSLGTLIGSYFKADKQALKKIEESRALMAWPALVGDSAARVSKAIRVRGYQLVVKVNDPLWMTQLSYLKHDLIEKYQTQFPHLGIRDIFFVR